MRSFLQLFRVTHARRIVDPKRIKSLYQYWRVRLLVNMYCGYAVFYAAGFVYHWRGEYSLWFEFAFVFVSVFLVAECVFPRLGLAAVCEIINSLVFA